MNSSARTTSHGAADQEHDQAEHQVHRADVLVVGREEPAADAFRRTVVVVVIVTGVGV